MICAYLFFQTANDCYSFDVDILSDSVNHCEAADSAQDCQHQCQHEEHCKEFVFITNANEKDQNCCHVESRTEGNEQTVAGFVSGPRFCGNFNNAIPKFSKIVIAIFFEQLSIDLKNIF